MTASPLAALLQNAAALLAMVAVFDVATSLRRLEDTPLRQAAVGVVLGGLGIGLILASFRLEPGIVFDTRSVLLAVSGLFLGAVPTLVAMAMTSAFRLAQGGSASWVGVAVILSAGGLGIAWRHYRRGPLSDISWRELYALGVAVHVVMLALMLTLPSETAWRVLKTIGLPVLVVYPAATVALGLLMAGRIGRERTIAALRDAEERFRTFFDQSPVGSSLTAPDGQLQRVNPAFCRLTGYSADELAKLSFESITHPDDLAESRASARSLLAGERDTWSTEKRYVTKDGRTVWVQLDTTLARDGQGHPLTFLTHVLDITGRRQAEEDKEKLQAQLSQAQRMEAVGRLAGGVAHDYNNMLSVILGYAELALDRVDPTDPLHGYLSEIHAAARRSTEVTRQLLAFARKEAIAPRVLDLNETVESMLKMLRRLIGEDVALVWSPGANLRPVRMDPAQVDQVLANLCVNARDAIAGVGKVTIETASVAFDEAYCAGHPGSVPGDFALLAVSDDGCGMDAATLDRVFEPFFTSKAVGLGTGLGLATVYGIVTQNGGFINASSEPGHGTTFRIYLPHHQGQVAGARQDDTAAITSGSGETVLLVEDEEAILRVAERMLQRLGYTVLAAGTASDGLRLAAAHASEIRLVITDVVMPDMNGRELIEQLQAVCPAVKRLFMSGYTANVIAHRGVLDEGVHFIQKPFSLKDLAAKVKAAMDDPASPARGAPGSS